MYFVFFESFTHTLCSMNIISNNSSVEEEKSDHGAMFLKAVYHDIFDKNENYQRLILNHYYVYKKNAVFAFFFADGSFTVQMLSL